MYSLEIKSAATTTNTTTNTTTKKYITNTPNYPSLKQNSNKNEEKKHYKFNNTYTHATPHTHTCAHTAHTPHMRKCC